MQHTAHKYLQNISCRIVVDVVCLGKRVANRSQR